MNERFRELYEHAIPPSLRGAYMEIHLEKFAELLVKECAEYIDAFNKENMVEEGIGGTELKQHFGVEK
jgi:hypothetical protein